jgi:hypothetical protein
LRAEAIGSDALHRAGLLVARNKIIQTPTRTFLLSPRFDRVGELGRKHVVSMGAVHQAFSKLAYVSWPSTCDILVGQRRLPKADAGRAHAIFQFGRLIGNTDMHSGNAGLFVHGGNLKEIVAGNFSLAPVYDMLPMRWKPDPMVGTQDYEPFDVDLTYADVATRLAAQDFWRSLAAESGVSHSLQQVAQLMATKMKPTNT